MRPTTYAILPIAGLLAFTTQLPLVAQDKNPQKPRLVWAAKPVPPTAYDAPNRLIWRLSEILAAHKGQASWRLPVLEVLRGVAWAPGSKH